MIRVGGARALLHSVYDQPDADSVRADILAFTAFPKEVWRQVWSNNLWVPKSCVTWGRCSAGRGPASGAGEPVLARPDVR
jgi:hypothetical protein